MERSYRIQVAARLAGLREDLVRAWERRYRVVKPKRTDGGYRVYTDRDVRVLQRLKQLTQEGVAISQAARQVAAIRKELDGHPPATHSPKNGSVDEWQTQLLEAATDLDQARAEEILDRALAALQPLAVFEDVLSPVMREMDKRWRSGDLVDSEYPIALQAIRTRMFSLIHGAPRGERKHVLCAPFPQERHDIGALGTALRFRYSCMRVTLCCQPADVGHLGRTVQRLKPNAVVLASECPMTPRKFRGSLADVIASLPKRTPLWLTGANATHHRQIARDLGARVV